MLLYKQRSFETSQSVMKTLCVIAVKKHPQAVSGHASDPNSSFVRITKKDPVAVRKKFLLEPLTSIWNLKGVKVKWEVNISIYSSTSIFFSI